MFLISQSSISSDNGLGCKRPQAIIWTNGDLVYWRIYASLGLNELIYCKTSSISRTKSQSLNVSCILLQLSSLNRLKPGVELRMKM